MVSYRLGARIEINLYGTCNPRLIFRRICLTVICGLVILEPNIVRIWQKYDEYHSIM